VPGISRVLVLSYLVDPIAPLQVKALQEASRSLSVTLQVHDIRTADDLPVDSMLEPGIAPRVSSSQERAYLLLSAHK
jgi:hypothetical protein